MPVGWCILSWSGISKHDYSPTSNAAEDDDASQFDVTAPHLGHLLFINMGVYPELASVSSTTKLAF